MDWKNRWCFLVKNCCALVDWFFANIFCSHILVSFFVGSNGYVFFTLHLPVCWFPKLMFICIGSISHLSFTLYLGIQWSSVFYPFNLYLPSNWSWSLVSGHHSQVPVQPGIHCHVEPERQDKNTPHWHQAVHTHPWEPCLLQVCVKGLFSYCVALRS